MVPRGLKSNFRRKMKNTIFIPKLTLVEKSIFGPKIKSYIFQPKLAQKRSLEILIDYCSKNNKIYYQPKMDPTAQKLIFGKKK